MSNQDDVPGFFETLRREPIMAIISVAFCVGVGWWLWKTYTYRDIAQEDRQYCFLIASVASQAAEARDAFVSRRSFSSQFSLDIGAPLTADFRGAIEFAYHNTLMSSSELGDHVEGQCLWRFRHAVENE